MVIGEIAAAGGQAVNALVNQRLGGAFKRLQQIVLLEVPHPLGNGFFHHAVAYRKGPGIRIADIAEVTAEMRFTIRIPTVAGAALL